MPARDKIDATVKETTWPIWRQGDGAAVLILHGADGAAGWAGVQTGLASQHQCLLPEHPGFEGSPMPAWLDRISDLANAYLELIESSRWGHVHLVGHDLGGWIAAEMAVRNSGALASLSLVAPQGIHVPGVPTIDVFLRTDEQLVRDTFHSEALVKQQLETPNTPEQDEIAIRNKEVAARLTWQPRGYDLDLQKWLHRISVPTQIIWGAQDAILPSACATAWQAAIPGAGLHTIEACGHAPQREQPEALARQLAQFIAQARNAA